MPQFRIVNADKEVIQESEFESNEKAYDWFKEQSEAADDSLGYGLEVNYDGEWEFLDQTDGGTNTSGSDD